MKLILILGVTLLVVLICQIYMSLKEKEGFSNEILEAGERSFLNKQDDYWGLRSVGIGAGLLKTDPEVNKWLKLDKDKNLKIFTPEIGGSQSDMDKKITQCRVLNSCDQLQEGTQGDCGYCAYDKEFRYGGKGGPSPDVCPKEAWTNNRDKCKELREKEICSNVKSCGDLYGESADICGFCPTTGAGMAKKEVGDKLMPKYSDDVCGGDGAGLLSADKCGQFLKDHPCITPYYLSGPHSAACVRKLWKNSGCTNNVLYGKTPNKLGDSIRMPYKEAGTIMNETNNSTRSNIYNSAIQNSDICFGNNDNIDPCDPKFNKNGIPHPVCLKREFLKSGCDTNGEGYEDIEKGVYGSKNHVRKVSKYSKDQVSWDIPGFRYPSSNLTNADSYKETIKRVNKLMVEAGDYDTRSKTSLICLGTSPPSPPDITAGCTVTKELFPIKYTGTVTKMRGSNCDIMWTESINLTTNKKEDRTTMDRNTQAAVFGWPAIDPIGKTSLETSYTKGQLAIKEPVCGDEESGCKRTCDETVADVLYKYPPPRDCIVGNWSGYNNCSKSCGGGSQYRTRPVLYNAKFGGKPCPPVKQWRVCAQKPCLNPNFY